MRRLKGMQTASDSPNRRVSKISSFHQKPTSTKKAGLFFSLSAFLCTDLQPGFWFSPRRRAFVAKIHLRRFSRFSAANVDCIQAALRPF
jgi:hypothetical protein